LRILKLSKVKVNPSSAKRSNSLSATRLKIAERHHIVIIDISRICNESASVGEQIAEIGADAESLSESRQRAIASKELGEIKN
jgi:hypothetical protein